MAYQFFSTESLAQAFLTQVQAQGFRGFVLRLRADEFEVRYWA